MGDLNESPVSSALDEEPVSPGSDPSGDVELVEEGYCAKEVLSGVNQLLKRKLYCDLQIKVAGKTLLAHKTIIAGFSPYFLRRIVNDAEVVLEVDFVSEEIFEVILQYAYTSAITISTSNAEQLLRASCRLEVPHLTRLCAEYLGKRINADNFLSLYEIARSLSCGDLADSANQFILKNFKDVCSLDVFLKLRPEMLIEAIKSDDLEAPNEETVLDAVIRWTNHDVEREPILPKVLQHVRLSFIDVEALDRCMKEQSAIRTSVDCMFWISQVVMSKSHPDICDKHSLLDTFWKPRRVIGPPVTPDETSDTNIESIPTSNAETTYTNEVTTPQVVAETASCDVRTPEGVAKTGEDTSERVAFSDYLKEVVVCKITDSKKANPCYYLLSVKDGKMRKLVSLPEKWGLISHTMFGNNMYALVKRPLFFNSNAVLQYNFLSDTWETIPGVSLPATSSGEDLIFDIIALRDSLYFFIGRDGYYDVCIEQFDFVRGTFCKRSEMLVPCSDCRLIKAQDAIFSFGTNKCIHDRATVSRYDSNKNQWSLAAPMLVKADWWSAIKSHCEFNGKIYLMGTGKNCPLIIFQVYDIAKNKWMWGPPLEKDYDRPLALAAVGGRLAFVALGRNSRFLDVEEFVWNTELEDHSWSCCPSVKLHVECEATDLLTILQ